MGVDAAVDGPTVVDARDAVRSPDAPDVPMVGDAGGDAQAGYDGPRPAVPLPASCPPARAQGGSNLVIDDLASGNGQIIVTDGRNGFWYDRGDGSAGNLSPSPSTPLQVALGSGPRGGYAARMAGSGFTSSGAAMGFSFSQSEAGICPYDASPFSGISFWAKAASPLLARFNVLTADTQDARDGGSPASGPSNPFGFPVAVATTWQKYTIAFGDLIRKASDDDAHAVTFDSSQLIGVEFQVPSNTTFDLSVTDLAFTPVATFGPHAVELCPDSYFDPAPMPSLPHPSPVTFTIDANDTTKKHPISPLIYGVNGTAWSSSEALTKDIRDFGYSLLRIEAGSDTLYNWEISAINGGYNGSAKTLSNYFFPFDALLPAQVAVNGFVAARARSATLLVGLSLLDYVAGDGAGDMDASDSAILTTRFKQNKPTKGAAFSLIPETGDKFVYQDEYVNWVMQNRPSNVPVIFQLDNEPDIWDMINPEIHPNHVGYDEYIGRTIALAKATKQVAPDAQIVGIVTGSPSALDTLSAWYSSQKASAADLAKGNFLDYFLTKMATESATFGKQLVDYVDFHYYANTVAGSGTTADPYIPLLALNENPIYTNTNAKVVALRLQAPRSLWDPTFVETTSWEYQNTSLQGKPLTIIPRVKKQIAALAPSVKLAISEWNIGGGNHISGGLAIADTLGIFGREGLDMSAFFPLFEWENYARGAIKAFRSYDAVGGQFGDISISATTSDVAATSVYASLDSHDPSRMVIVAINKTSDAVAATVNIAGAPAAYSGAQVFVLAEGASYLQAGKRIAGVTATGFNYTLPRYSVSVIVPRATEADDEPVAFAPDCVRTGNLALSSDFEETADGWMSWGDAKKTLSTDVAHTGTHSLRVARRTETWNGPAFTFAGADPNTGFLGTVRNGYRYDYSGWVRLGGSDGTTGQVLWTFTTTDDSGNHYATSASATATTSGWIEVKGSCTPTINGVLNSANLSMSGAASGVDIYLDDVTITATKIGD